MIIKKRGSGANAAGVICLGTAERLEAVLNTRIMPPAPRPSQGFPEMSVGRFDLVVDNPSSVIDNIGTARSGGHIATPHGHAKSFGSSLAGISRLTIARIVLLQNCV